MENLAGRHAPGGDPLHDLRHESFDHLGHRRECGDGVVGHTLATLAQPLDQQARLYHQLAHLGEQARQHLPLFLFALGKQVVFFDRSEDRLDLRDGGIDTPHAMRFELRQGTATALRHTPQDTRFVGIPNRQLLRCCIGREDTDIGKAQVLGDMEDQRIDLLDPVLAQGCIGPGDVGMVPNLSPGGVLSPNEHARHHIL
jgi:hypothetical protein